MKNVLKGIVTVLYVCVFLVLAKQSLNYFYNEYVLSHYEKNDFTINDNLLLTANYIEPYICHYNNANILYKNCLFEDAIDEYLVTLEYDLPEGLECKIRINMALSTIALLPEDYDEYENIPDSIETLKEARDYLYDGECATPDQDGHSEDAETLAQEITDEIERLEELLNQPPEDPNGEGEGGDPPQDPQQPQEPQDPQEPQEPQDPQDPQDPQQPQQPQTVEEIIDALNEKSDETYEYYVEDGNRFDENDEDYKWGSDYIGIW